MVNRAVHPHQELLMGHFPGFLDSSIVKIRITMNHLAMGFFFLSKPLVCSRFWISVTLLIITITISSNVSIIVVKGCNRRVTSANHIKCTQLNPSITQVITITIATTTYPTKLGIFQKLTWYRIGLEYQTGDFPK